MAQEHQCSQALWKGGWEKTLKLWRKRLQDNAFWWVLYARFSLFQFHAHEPALRELQGTLLGFHVWLLLGFVPLAVVFATFGSGGIKGNLWQIVLATILLILPSFHEGCSGSGFLQP
jgi:uncharacterized membrane protein YdjX (TVP38/TMEM64 family)